MNRFEKILEEKRKRQALELSSPLEEHVFKWMNLCHMYPVREYQLGVFLLDFAFLDNWVAVEVDGKKFHSSSEHKKRDQEKDEFARGQGWTILRWRSDQCWSPKKLALLLDDLWKYVGQRDQRPFMLCELLNKEIEVQRSTDPCEGWCYQHNCFTVDCTCFDKIIED